MYYAFGLRDLLSVAELNKEFFEELDTFQLNFIEMVFKLYFYCFVIWYFLL